MANGILDEYKTWIIDLTVDWCSPHGSYNKLMEYLYSRVFVAVMARDNNRISDGNEIRLRFVETIDNKNYRDAYLYLNHPVTVLEVIAALAIRCDEEITWDFSNGDRSGEWFFEMINNLGLANMDDFRYDETYVAHVIDTFLERRYQKNGFGGLFVTNNEDVDMRKYELWKQLMIYINEFVIWRI